MHGGTALAALAGAGGPHRAVDPLVAVPGRLLGRGEPHACLCGRLRRGHRGRSPRARALGRRAAGAFCSRSPSSASTGSRPRSRPAGWPRTRSTPACASRTGTGTPSGVTAAMGIPLCLWLGTRDEGRRPSSIARLSAARRCLIVTMLLSFSRGSIIAALVGVALWLAIVPLRLRSLALLLLGPGRARPVTAWAFTQSALTDDRIALAERKDAGVEVRPDPARDEGAPARRRLLRSIAVRSSGRCPSRPAGGSESRRSPRSRLCR